MTDRLEDGKKPTVTGPVNGNAFAVIAAVKQALKRAGFKAEAQTFVNEAFQCGSYDDLLALAQCYVNFEL